MPSLLPQPYRPCNGDEGDWFMGQWCERCAFAAEDEPCMIQGRALAFGLDDPDYPPEWVEDDSGPRCTAFVAAVEDERGGVIRDKRQIGLPL